MQNDSSRHLRYGFRFSLRNLLLATLLVALLVAWFTGRIVVAETQSSRIASFGQLNVYEWEVPESAKGVYLRVDGKRSSRIDVKAPARFSETVRLAMVEERDSVIVYMQIGGGTVRSQLSTPTTNGSRQSWKGRQFDGDLPVPLLVHEVLDDAQEPIKKIEFVVE